MPSSPSSTASPSPGRGDLLQRPLPSSPPPPPLPLGQANLHGPPRPSHLVIIIGVGPGIGLNVAHQFATQGYATALLSRDVSRLESWAEELHSIASARLKSDGEEEAPATEARLSRGVFCDVLDPESVKKALESALSLFPGRRLGTAVYNASVRVKRRFVEQSTEQMRSSYQASVESPFIFFKECVKLFKQTKQGGNLLVTGATASTRGREGFAAFSVGKTGLRRLCEVVAREHGKDGIHVAHIIIDGLIDSLSAREHLGLSASERFHPDSVVDPREAAKAYVYLAQQSPCAWTFEMDLRPAKEKF